MTKHKADKTPQMGFWERNRKSGGYLLQKLYAASIPIIIGKISLVIYLSYTYI